MSRVICATDNGVSTSKPENTKRCDLIRSLNGTKAFPFQLTLGIDPGWPRSWSSNEETAFSVKKIPMYILHKYI